MDNKPTPIAKGTKLVNGNGKTLIVTAVGVGFIERIRPLEHIVGQVVDGA